MSNVYHRPNRAAKIRARIIVPLAVVITRWLPKETIGYYMKFSLREFSRVCTRLSFLKQFFLYLVGLYTEEMVSNLSKGLIRMRANDRIFRKSDDTTVTFTKETCM